MSGPKPSKYVVRSNKPSPSSLRETLLRKQGIYAPDGNKGTQPRAEFRGKLPDYQSSHGRYDGYLNFVSKTDPMCRNQHYQRREPPNYNGPYKTRGLVDEFDSSVRARNMPIIFEKQMRERGDPLAERVHKILFPTDSQYTCEAKYRPQVGCCLTRFWSDHQVETWSKYARYMRISYSGRLDYAFPSGCKGKTISGVYYSINKPWPSPGQDVEPPVFRRIGGHRRSEFSRIKRSLRKIKEVTAKPLDFSQLLVVRKELPQREIKRRWNKDRTMSYQEYRSQIPYILSLNTKHPHPVPEIVQDALKRIARRVSKIYPGTPWIIPEDEPMKATYGFGSVPTLTRQRHSKLMLYLSADGNVYYNRSGNNGKINLLTNRSDVSVSKLSSIMARLAMEQSKLDLTQESSDPEEVPHGTFGSWDLW